MIRNPSSRSLKAPLLLTHESPGRRSATEYVPCDIGLVRPILKAPSAQGPTMWFRIRSTMIDTPAFLHLRLCSWTLVSSILPGFGCGPSKLALQSEDDLFATKKDKLLFKSGTPPNCQVRYGRYGLLFALTWSNHVLLNSTETIGSLPNRRSGTGRPEMKHHHSHELSFKH